jgi:hypothetical protein
MLTKGYLRKDSIGPPDKVKGTAPARREQVNADTFADRMKDIQAILCSSLEVSHFSNQLSQSPTSTGCATTRSLHSHCSES